MDLPFMPPLVRIVETIEGDPVVPPYAEVQVQMQGPTSHMVQRLIGEWGLVRCSCRCRCKCRADASADAHPDAGEDSSAGADAHQSHGPAPHRRGGGREYVQFQVQMQVQMQMQMQVQLPTSRMVQRLVGEGCQGVAPAVAVSKPRSRGQGH